jgi:MFS family permease
LCGISPRGDRNISRIICSRPTKKPCLLRLQRSSTPRRLYWWNVPPPKNNTRQHSTAGLVTTYASWRWAFYLQGIMTAVFVVAACIFVPNDRKLVTRREPIDWFGALLVSGGLCGLCFALTDAEISKHGWATPCIIAALVLGVAALVLFILLQARLKYPLMPLTIWRYPQFPRVIAVYFLGFTTFGGVLNFNMNLMWQLVFGRKAVGVWPP